MASDYYDNLNVKIGSQKWIHCNNCQGRTNHQLIAFHRSPTWWYDLGTMEVIDEDYEGKEDEGYIEFRLWACLGCEICLMEVLYNEGEPLAPRSKYCPPRQLHGITAKAFHRLPRRLTGIYEEVIRSFNDSLNTLCAIGLRALLEGVCSDKGIKGKNLQQQIEGLKTILPENIVNHLHSFRFIGNEAVHDLEAPSQYALKQCIEVIEDLLNFLYDLEYKAGRVARGVKRSRWRRSDTHE
jgi:hypothetical protein